MSKADRLFAKLIAERTDANFSVHDLCTLLINS